MSSSAPATAMKQEDWKDATNDDAASSSVVTESFPPSHILQDGRFIHLPPPSAMERSRFFERAIAQFGLLEADIKQQSKGDTLALHESTKEAEADEAEAAQKASKQPKVHPLAVASARLQANGIAELNRAINLSNLVATGEYFGWTNIVDPSLELGAAAAAAAEAAKSKGTDQAKKSTKSETASSSSQPATVEAGDGEGPTAPATESKEATAAPTTAPPADAANVAAATKSMSEKEMHEEQGIKAAFVLKRKRAQFERASRLLHRHETRLAHAIAAQAVPDQRLRQLRPHWRLVAPEHGTRAKPHAVRPTEVVAVDVDVYDQKGSGADQQLQRSINNASLVGRLASRVPRYATIELTKEYKPPKHISVHGDRLDENGKKVDDERPDQTVKQEEGEIDAMDIDTPTSEQVAKEEDRETDKARTNENGSNKDGHGDPATIQQQLWTRAEPFAVFDPTLGKISADFDPTKVTMLTLQFDIEKPSTGFCMSACLQPMTTGVSLLEQNANASTKKDSNKTEEGDQTKMTEPNNIRYREDEQVLVSLQHSLFCAKLFESIRRELMGDDAVDERGQPLRQQQHSVVWLTSESEENFLPPPSLMVQSVGGAEETTTSRGSAHGGALCVVHCHESEVKVQLDTEYTLRAKLVEANDGISQVEKNEQNQKTADRQQQQQSGKSSGSQSPAQLLVLCRSLLLHAQEEYHTHSLHQRAEQDKKLQQAQAEERSQKPKGLDRIQKKGAAAKAKILQSCVALGAKMLFERRIRKALVRVRKWLKSHYPKIPDVDQSLKTEWLSLSLFDLQSQFCLNFGVHLTVDVTIVRDEMTMTSFHDVEGTMGAAYRKVKFHSDAEFEMFLKMELRRQLKQQKQHQQQDPQAALAPMATAVS